jgi:Fe-S-cluster containining protein
VNEGFPNLPSEEHPGEEGFVPISKKQTFYFHCAPEVPCFNECCRDLDQFLYPYDVLRLKNRLQITSSQFLEQYVQQHVGSESGLPVLSLIPVSSADRRCPFVTEAGCSVYPDRPASCRSYPIGRAVARCRETGGVQEHFVLIRERHCRGFESAMERTPDQWMRGQDLIVYNRENDRLLELISRKNRMHPGPLDLVEQRIFVQSLYDLDRFRRHVFAENRLQPMKPDADALARAEKDETALLSLAHEWVQFCLFGA